MAADRDPVQPPFGVARAETVRYHREAYAGGGSGQDTAWIGQPHRLLYDALRRLRVDRPVMAYDLGAGVGRHTIPLLRALPTESTVIAVDLLEEAMTGLRRNAPRHTGVHLRTITADLNTFRFGPPADLVVAISALEHLPTADAMAGLMTRAADAVSDGGVAVVGILADRRERTPNGSARPALVETAMSATAAHGLLRHAFRTFTVTDEWDEPARIAEQREGAAYTLEGTFVCFLAQRAPATT